MNAEEKDRLKGLFQEMKLDEPSSGFESRLMQRVHVVAAKKSRRQNIKSIIAITCGIIGILGIPAFIFWRLGLSLKTEMQDVGSTLSFSMPSIDFNPFVVSVACVGVLLFISDTLIRRHIREKRHKD
ncbi:hypothetical protein D0T84_17220 [Dysgonomonas sp. 521]|uniref:hypothetical protein n=1 Tax=Dysgonomonas sp. 521 TaxID=2302932 RepID=UPI0013D08122|nr:hypothetical protein [Dysgonomonas sp. 521]NDV96639.1 hypothetical protein [Dysgonomonas sp. 521]